VAVIKDQVLAAADRLGMFALAKRASARRLRILCYHGLWTTPGYQYGDRLFMPPELFEHRMTRLKRSGYPVLGLDEAVDALEADQLPDHAVVITIDDGWASTYTHMLPVLEALGLPATVYVTSWYVGRDLPVVNKAVDYLNVRLGRNSHKARSTAQAIDSLPYEQRVPALKQLSAALRCPLDWWETRQFHLMTEAEVADCVARGLDVQLHTHRHVAAPATLEREIVENRERLAAWTGLPESHFRHFCYPSGEYEPAAEPILTRLGIGSATLIDQGTNAPGAHPFRLRRFLDGRSVSDAEFDAYLAGALDTLDAAVALVRPH
jgi:peptidoglycan/xylan/chitin deacetylase (PgdA/CDA1 family)